MAKTFSHHVGCATSAISLNKDSNHVAVVGRSIFKIFSIEQDRFEESLNLRVMKGVNSSYNDLVWSHIDENILASASTGGNIVIWNLAKAGFSKMDQVFSDHKRTVNKICFHESDPSLLISGSQDSIKLFDLRTTEAVVTFSGLSESVRDLQFCPHKHDTFVAVLDNGYIQLYDIRKDKYERSFPGHNGPILACDWHLETSDCFATAGRDMNIKVWSIDNPATTLQHSIPTMESVSRVKWSHQNDNHIASCSLKRDYNINVWNVERPFLATYRFQEPKEVTIGMAWRCNSNYLVSSSKDGYIFHLYTGDAIKPIEHANPVGLAINPDGDIALAIGNKMKKPTATHNEYVPSNSSSSRFSLDISQNSTNSTKQVTSVINVMRPSYSSNLNSKQVSKNTSSKSQLGVYKCTELNWFVKTAQEYQLAKRPLAELCDHNAAVCAELKRFQLCQTWKILKLFYANVNPEKPTSTIQNVNVAFNTPSRSSQQNQRSVDQVSITSEQGSSRSVSSVGSKVLHSKLKHNKMAYGREAYDANEASGDLGCNKLDKGDNICDAIIDAADNSDAGDSDEWNEGQYSLAYEAFQPKYDIIGGGAILTPTGAPGYNTNIGGFRGSGNESRMLIDSKSISNSPPSNFITGQTGIDDDMSRFVSTLGGGHHSRGILHDEFGGHESNVRSLLGFSETNYFYQSKFYDIIADVVADVLKCHVENSDVQSAVSILIVLGERIKNIVDERIAESDRESWFHSYIDLLSRYQLWNVMAQVINLSPLSDINSINQTSTTIYTTCGLCLRPLNGKVGWICDKCQTKPAECSVCHGVVAGLMSWCQGCYHGGHLVHMSQWFAECDYCPTGCGHLCELGEWQQSLPLTQTQQRSNYNIYHPALGFT